MSTDGGTVWNQKDSYYGDGGCCVVDPESASVIFTGGQGPLTQTNGTFVVSFSRNNGTTWTRCNLSEPFRGWCYSLAPAPSQPATIYAGGWVNGQGAVYRSSDRGITWQPSSSSPPDTVFGLAVAPTEPGRVYAATASGVYRTSDGGATWSHVHSVRGARAIVLHPVAPETIAVGGDRGVYVSGDAGQSWVDISQGLETRSVSSLGFVDADGLTLLAGTAGRGCWRLAPELAGRELPPVRSLRAAGMGASVVHGVLDLKLSSGRAWLSDISGQRVREVRSGPNDISGLAPGVYFLTLPGTQPSSVHRIVVMR